MTVPFFITLEESFALCKTIMVRKVFLVYFKERTFFSWGTTLLEWKLYYRGRTFQCPWFCHSSESSISIAERAGAEGSPPSAAPGQVRRSTPETLWCQLPPGQNIFSHWLSCPFGPKKSFSDLVSVLQVDLERELEHKDVLLAHCMKREADEVT